MRVSGSKSSGRRLTRHSLQELLSNHLPGYPKFAAQPVELRQNAFVLCLFVYD
jgi:hypothetical protein